MADDDKKFTRKSGPKPSGPRPGPKKGGKPGFAGKPRLEGGKPFEKREGAAKKPFAKRLKTDAAEAEATVRAVLAMPGLNAAAHPSARVRVRKASRIRHAKALPNRAPAASSAARVRAASGRRAAREHFGHGRKESRLSGARSEAKKRVASARPAVSTARKMRATALRTGDRGPKASSRAATASRLRGLAKRPRRRPASASPSGSPASASPRAATPRS